jgi:hypothetical protein
MRSILNEAFEWLDRAEQAREAAGQLTDPLGACLKPRSARPSRRDPCRAKEKGIGFKGPGKNLMIFALTG